LRKTAGLLAGTAQNSCTIVLYHSVPSNKKKRFIGQVDYLLKATTPVSLDFDGGPKKGARYSVVTFDDAFRSALENGVPELVKRRIPFAIFVPAGQLGMSGAWSFALDDHDKYETVATIDEFQDLPGEYVTLGSHSISHTILTELSETAAYEEIRGSKAMLESYFGVPIRYFAFPGGYYNKKTIDMCKEAGYKQVFSIEIESPFLPMDRYMRGRVCVDPSQWMIEFKLEVLGAYCWRPFASSIRHNLLRRSKHAIERETQ
jgi:peptidoglycan/xylan/chitin deacetylase (PgdA/CDA1 family)